MEAAEGLIACLNWALHHGPGVSPAEVTAWQVARNQAPGLCK